MLRGIMESLTSLLRCGERESTSGMGGVKYAPPFALSQYEPIRA